MRMIGQALATGLLVLLPAIGVWAHDGGGTTTTPSGQASQANSQAKVYFDQGESYSKQKNWEQAIAAYQQAIRIDPKYAEAWNNMGFCYRKVKQYDKALDAYKQAMALKPDFPHPHEYLGRTYLAMGNKD